MRCLALRMVGEGLGHFVRRQFEPHVTLLYRKLPIDSVEVAPITWMVRELVLVKSLYGPGPTYPCRALAAARPIGLALRRFL